jgi:hypothetical protein
MLDARHSMQIVDALQPVTIHELRFSELPFVIQL